MPAFLEFLLVAFLIYLWESALWLPKRGVALRRSRFGKSWRVISATRYLSTRELGVVPMLPIPPDSGLAPCPGFPLAVDGEGNIFIESAEGDFRKTDARSWDDIRHLPPHLHAGNSSVRCQSPGVLESLTSGKKAGLSLREAIRRSAALSLSPARAKRSLRRWRIVSSPLRLYAPVLTVGFFAGLPAAYLTLGPMAALWLAAWLWCLMAAISCHLFWLAKSAYPAARSELRQDALLSLLIPFHAMRAAELASVHTFSGTHPAAILISSGATSHPWLCGYIRNLLFPRPSHRGDAAQAYTALAVMEKILASRGMGTDAFASAPDRSSDPEAVSYCPRCHGMFLTGTETCSDCGGLQLRRF